MSEQGDPVGREEPEAEAQARGGGEDADRGQGAARQPDPDPDPSAASQPLAARRRRLPASARIAAAILGPALLTTAYFTIPFGALGPKHPVLPWVIVITLLTLLAVGMVLTTNGALTGTSDRFQYPGLWILLLSWAAILVFSASYWAMATRENQFVGLQTRLDALYFVGVTMATVGYGDIHPSGQLGRAVVLVQIVYTFAFLVSGIAALRTRARARLHRPAAGDGDGSG